MAEVALDQWESTETEEEFAASIASGLRARIADTRHHPNVMVMSPQIYAAYEYEVNTTDVAEWPGYKRRRGPDGRTWLQRTRSWSDFYWHSWGNGNKAKRRIGMDPERISTYMESGYGNLRPHEVWAPWENVRCC